MSDEDDNLVWLCVCGHVSVRLTCERQDDFDADPELEEEEDEEEEEEEEDDDIVRTHVHFLYSIGMIALLPGLG
jgi:hypothetical protein